MTKLKITVDKETLAKSANCGAIKSTNCAIAVAIRDIFPEASVGTTQISTGTKLTYFPGTDTLIHQTLLDNVTIPLPIEAQKFIEEFDSSTPAERLQMEPISFEIELPDILVENINIKEMHPDMLSFEENFNRGLEGKNLGIPMGFKRLSRVVGLRRATYYLLGGYTGSGKTGFLDDAFILNPSEWWLGSNKEIDLKIIYFSMERRKSEKIAKWISRSIFNRDGIIVPMNDILSWNSIADGKIKKLVDRHKEYINTILEEVVDLYENPINPTGIYMTVRDFALQRGEFVPILTKDKNGNEVSKKIYVPKNSNEIVLVAIDHVGLCKGETEKETKTFLRGKPLIDKMSEYLREIRDIYGYSPVVVSQFNRGIANPLRLKTGDASPILEDFKDTGDTQEDSEVVISLFDPIRYGQEDPSGYNLDKLVDENGSKKYRSIEILKNSYGPEGVRIGMALQPQVGMFREMPKFRDITEEDYNSILDDSYFLK